MTLKNTIATFSLIAFGLSASAQNQTQAPEPSMPDQPADKVSGEAKGSIKKARVFFIEPKDGATVPKKFKVKMGVEGLKVRAAGEAPDEVTSGHHHITINAEPLAAGVPVPTDKNHIHFGKGQTEVELTLPPGEHRLTLQFADGAHRSFGPAMSQTIKIKVR